MKLLEEGIQHFKNHRFIEALYCFYKCIHENNLKGETIKVKTIEYLLETFTPLIQIESDENFEMSLDESFSFITKIISGNVDKLTQKEKDIITQAQLFNIDNADEVSKFKLNAETSFCELIIYHVFTIKSKEIKSYIINELELQKHPMYQHLDVYLHIDNMEEDMKSLLNAIDRLDVPNGLSDERNYFLNWIFENMDSWFSEIIDILAIKPDKTKLEMFLDKCVDKGVDIFQQTFRGQPEICHFIKHLQNDVIDMLLQKFPYYPGNIIIDIKQGSITTHNNHLDPENTIDNREELFQIFKKHGYIKKQFTIPIHKGYSIRVSETCNILDNVYSQYN